MNDSRQAMTGKALLNDSAKVALATVCVGAVSYLLLFVGAKLLDSRSLAEFVTLWAILNTAVLAVVLPADTFAPRFRLEAEKIGLSDLEIRHSIRDYALVVSFFTCLVFISLQLIGVLGVEWQVLVASGGFLVANSIFGSQRAYLSSAARFSQVLMKSAIYLGVSVLGFVMLFVLDSREPFSLILVVTFALLVASAARISAPTEQSTTHRPRRSRWQSIRRETTAVKSLASLSLITFLTLILSNGALAVAHVIGADERSIVVYAAILNLVMVPCTLLNAVTPPVHVRAVEALRQERIVDFRRLYWIAVAGYGAVVAAVVLIMSLVGSIAVRLYITEAYSATRSQLFGIAMAETLATLTVLPRVFLVALGRASDMNIYWLFGLLIFAGTFFAPWEPIVRMIVAPLLASIFIFVAGTVRLERHVRGLSATLH
jgi:hypothetical protein